MTPLAVEIEIFLRLGLHTGAVSHATPIRSTVLISTLSQRLGPFTDADVRAAVHELRIAGIPVGSDDRGYFIARRPEELRRTMAHLHSRRNKIDQAIEALNKSRHALTLKTTMKGLF